MKTIPLKLDGYTDLPPGKLANIVTYLEMTAPPRLNPPAEADDLRLRRMEAPDPDWYREVIGQIGADWMWVHIPLMPAPQLAALVANPAVEIYALERDRTVVGIAELDRRTPGVVEIVMFGVMPDAVGTGAAHRLMQGTLAAAFREDTRRVWLHTCTHDHPSALRFYRRAGFVPYKLGIEVMDDPRVSGAIAETTAPHIPLIRPKPENP